MSDGLSEIAFDEYAPRDLAEQTLDGTLPYQETWRENAVNVLKLSAEIERLRGERFDVSNVKVRDLGLLATKGLTIMRDEDDDEWELPDLVTINHALSAVEALVQHAEDRQRFKRALSRIAKEWTDETATAGDIRAFAQEVLAGRSARIPFSSQVTRIERTERGIQFSWPMNGGLSEIAESSFRTRAG